MRIGVPREIHPGEKRVATTPEVVPGLLKLGFEVAVESGAGDGASFTDQAYLDAGAVIVESADELWSGSDIILKVRAPGTGGEADRDELDRLRATAEGGGTRTARGASGQDELDRLREAVEGDGPRIVQGISGRDEVDRLREGQILISFLWPAQNPELLNRLADKRVTALAMDSIPRISRAQKLDALSSMANIAGYRAVVEAADNFGRFFMGQITAAGKVPPARVLVIGAGVAGLSAIGTAKSMGAIVRAFDTRPEVKEQVESMDAEFLLLDFEEEGGGAGGYAKVMSKEFIAAEMALFRQQAEEVDIIVTTALIPGKPAPKLITADMVETMRPGGVIVDLAAEQGGNCELTEPDQLVTRHGVTIIGYTDLPSRLASTASQLYATNLRHLLSDMCPEQDGAVIVNMDDEVIRGATVVKDGEIVWPPPAPKLTARASARSKTPGSAEQRAAGAPGPSGKSTAAERRAAGMAPASAEQRATGAPAPSGKPTAAGQRATGPAPATAGQPRSATAPASAGAQRAPAWLGRLILFGLGGLGLLGLGAVAPPSFMAHFTVFVLACFVGYMVVWNVTPALHTPLMSVTNAISSIIIIGALLQISSDIPWISWVAGFTVLITSINIAGGFAVTRRMLAMFRK